MSNYPNQGATGRFGRGSFKKPSFSKKPWEGGGSRGGDDRPLKLHDAVCASCGKTCEVPFIPNGKKPVYCRDCFANERGGEGSGERSERPARREFSAPTRPYSQPENTNPKANDALLKQVEMMNAKLERLILAVEALSVKKTTKKVAVDK